MQASGPMRTLSYLQHLPARTATILVPNMEWRMLRVDRSNSVLVVFLQRLQVWARGATAKRLLYPSTLIRGPSLANPPLWPLLVASRMSALKKMCAHFSGMLQYVSHDICYPSSGHCRSSILGSPVRVMQAPVVSAMLNSTQWRA